LTGEAKTRLVAGIANDGWPNVKPPYMKTPLEI
jgi:hypothetical protein